MSSCTLMYFNDFLDHKDASLYGVLGSGKTR